MGDFLSDFTSPKLTKLILGLIKILLLVMAILFNKMIFLVCVSLLLILEIFSLFMKSEKRIIEEKEEFIEDHTPYKEECSNLKRDILSLQHENDKQRDMISRLYRSFKSSEISLEKTELLSRTSMVTVQSKVNKITDDIFSMITGSKNMTDDINELILSLTHGDESLHGVINRLNINIDEIDNISTKIGEVNRVITSDTSSVTDSLLEIRNFTNNILDLADQTSVLAINASIEAARSGIYGKGFAVIAGEVGKLADNSKVFAETINKMVKSAYQAMEEGLEKQNSLLKNVEDMLIRSQQEVHIASNSLLPKIELLAESINKSSITSSSMTEQLNSFTSSMQFLDLVRQIAEHIAIISRERWEETSKEFGEKTYDIDLDSLKEEVIREVTKHFTTKEEWEALGLTVKESMSNKTNNKDLKGDVLLF